MYFFFTKTDERIERQKWWYLGCVAGKYRKNTFLNLIVMLCGEARWGNVWFEIKAIRLHWIWSWLSDYRIDRFSYSARELAHGRRGLRPREGQYWASHWTEKSWFGMMGRPQQVACRINVTIRCKVRLSEGFAEILLIMYKGKCVLKMANALCYWNNQK